MRFKVDENLPTDAAELLRAAGHDCHSVYDEDLGGAPDPRVADACRIEGRVLVTLDRDFADLRAYPPDQYAGIVVLRVSKPDRDRILGLLSRVLLMFQQETLAQRLWIVEEHRIRIRRSQ